MALGLLAVGILALSGLSLSALKAGQKSSQVMEAGQVAVMKIEEVSAAARGDSSFWATDHVSSPYTTGSVKVGKTEYSYTVYSRNLINQATGAELGGGSHRLKKLDIEVSWFGNSSSDGYGKRVLRESCLLNQ